MAMLGKYICIVKAIGLSVVMFVCKNYNIKKAECQRIDVVELGFQSLRI